ncbi:MAG: glycosyltransferase family 4 protein [Magnetospirillum sp.]|nr:glycosyltransferase family 4 protein [Magnetospirillum sp.]
MKAKDAARWALMRAAALAPFPRPVAYVVEPANWSTHWDGHYYAGAIERTHPGTVAVAAAPWRAGGAVLHFGSQFVWEAWAPYLPRRRRTVVTYFHGKPEDGTDMARHVEVFLSRLGALDAVVTAATSTERRLLDWGVPRDKLALVPLGVDTALFVPPTAEQRAAARARLGIPAGRLVVGSFQKDGVGWGEGREPKLIKGPDLFVDTCRRLARDVPLFVLLTGPARGYVKAGLDAAGIPWRHLWLDDYRKLPECWHALDLYLMTSREEGGPKAVLESLASGVPLVTARTGMAEDVVRDGLDGVLVEPGDVDGFSARAASLLADPAAAAAMAASGRERVLGWDWERVAESLWTGVYRRLVAP